eukprot:6213435-Pleurochrysis_carterae.AAC.1
MTFADLFIFAELSRVHPSAGCPGSAKHQQAYNEADSVSWAHNDANSNTLETATQHHDVR